MSTKKSPLISSSILISLLSVAVIFLIVFTFKFTSFPLRNKAAGEINTPLIFFPADHAQHLSFRSEWWYLNLLTRTNVNGGQQKDLGYVISFSRLSGNNGLLSSRYDNSNKAFNQSTNTGGQLSGILKNNLLYVYYTSNTAYLTLKELTPYANGAKQYLLVGSTPQIGTFNLLLKERTVNPKYSTTPLLWGCTGRISVFSLNDTYYYSQPDLDISGTIKDIDGTTRQVMAGKAWLDHQWFNSAPPSDWKGHYWASFHYTKSSSVYNPGSHSGVGWVTQIYTSGPKYSYWVMRNFDGSNSCGEGGTVRVLANDPISKFPTKLALNLTSAGLAIPNLTSFSAKQVFTTPIGTFIEAASYINGVTGSGYTGLGFFETGIKN